MTILETATGPSSEIICQSWATEADLCDPCLAVDYADLEPHLLTASELLYYMTGQQFSGECEETIQPCAKRQSTYMSVPIGRHLSPWEPFPWSVCGCYDTDHCSCARRSKITLPRHPIREVTSVTIDGEDFADYEPQGNELIRTDGLGWPCCGNWTVSYLWGQDPPAIGVTAAAVLACELYLSCNPDAIEGQQCRLPRNITSITRQGVSVAFASLVNPDMPFRFGIWEIDLFLEAFPGTAGSGDIVNPDVIDQYRVVT